MQQVRIARKEGRTFADARRFVSEWMEASSMNRWFLRARLSDALEVHGEGSHWIEVRDNAPAFKSETA
ncbi:hypothetical protein [Pseudorhodoferax sp. Leaf267]|uniref:hypothetical protein n=1 Tax=Pseudorhodoferax sp. Leaf267 TaxID=1736316 RepID=UPI0012E13880|nr:hypothetical protein [Pseudorhodoferax sp. Leaf267]